MSKEIVMLTRSLPHHGLGGMEVVAWDLAKEFVRQGQAVRVITTSLPGHDVPFMEDGVAVVPLLHTSSGRYSRSWWKESRNYFKKHCMESTLGVLSVSAGGYGLLPLKGMMPDVPFILQAHGTSMGEIVSKFRDRRLPSLLSSVRNMAWIPKDLLAYRRFDYLVAVGDRVLHDLSRFPMRGVASAERVRLINNGIDTAIFHFSETGRTEVREKLGVSSSTPIFISASRLHAQKGVAHALRAFARLLRQLPEAVFLIAGDGPERENLKSLAKDLSVLDNVIFLSALSRETLADYLSAADVFVFLTNRVEGLPLNVLEALASGLPCVVSEHLNLPTSPLIHLVPPSQVDDVASVLARLLSRRESKSRENALPGEFELKKVGKVYLDLLCVR